MSWEAWGDGADDGMEGYVTEDRAEEMWVEGAQAMREMLARFVESVGDDMHKQLAASLRLNWSPTWPKDPGAPSKIAHSAWD